MKFPKTQLNRFAAMIGILAFFADLAAQAAPQALHVSGNKLQTASGCSVTFKGVNVDGLEYSSTGEGPTGGNGGNTLAVAQMAVTGWHSTIIRIPLNQDYWFGCQGANQANYQNIISGIVNYCSGQGVYVILDLHWSGQSSTATAPCGSGWGAANAQHQMADANAVTFWSSVATAYANNPAVIFDLYNEPYDSGNDNITPSVTTDTAGYNTWLKGGTLGGASFSTPGMQALLNAVRAAGATNVCLMGGLHWCANLSGLPASSVTNTGAGVMFATHLYGNNDGTSSSSWNAEVPSSLTSSYPVFVGEYGPSTSCNTDDSTFDNNIFAWLSSAAGIVGGTAWSMHNSSCPNLLSDWSFNPSTWGTAEKNFLATPWPTCSAGSPVPTGTPTRTGTPTYTFTPTATTVPPNITLTKTTGGPTSGYSDAAPITMILNVCNSSGSVTANSVTVTDNITNPLSWAFQGPGYSPWTVTVSGAPVSINPTGTTYPNLSWVVSNLPGGSCVPITFIVGSYSYSASDACQVVSDRGIAQWPGGGPVTSNTIAITVVCAATNTPTATVTKTSTLTSTPTYTLTSTPTRTNTPTGTPTNTPTRTNTPTNSPSATPTNTPAVPTNTPTATPSSTPTKTNTLTATLTNTPTRTYTNTASATPTNTIVPPTNTPTSTATSTPTPTRTNTASATSTLSSTPTATVSSTATRTFTASNTTTNTFSMTATATRTSTPTNSFTPTQTYTRTNTFTPTITPTFTLTSTGTLPPTSTPTTTATQTATSTWTFTFTSTSTPSATSSRTSTSTPSNTPSPTFSFTPTRTLSPTLTVTSTATGTASSTATATFSKSSTPSSTNSFTPTSTLTTTSSPTRTSTPSATPTSTLTFTPTLTDTSTNSPTGTLSPTLSPTPSFTFTATGTATPSATATSTATTTHTVTYTFSATPTATLANTSTGTPSATPTASRTPSGTPTNTFTLSWTPSATSTKTPTFTNTWTYTPTRTNTSTATPTFTFSATSTFSSTGTGTPTVTWTFTMTPTPTTHEDGKPVIYPNPSGGGTVQVLPPFYSGSSDVRIQIFTTAFRMVREDFFPDQIYGALPLELKDKTGVPLASGLYYVVIQTKNGRSVGKVLILR